MFGLAVGSACKVPYHVTYIAFHVGVWKANRNAKESNVSLFIPVPSVLQ